MSQEPLDPELKAVESTLGRLAPARSRLDRDRLMFQAGAMSVRLRIASTLGLAVGRGDARPLVVVSESVALATRSDPRVVVVRQEAVPAQQAVEPEPRPHPRSGWSFAE